MSEHTDVEKLVERADELLGWLATLAEALKGDAAQAMVDGRLTVEALSSALAAKDEALREAEQTLAYCLRELGSDYIRNTLLKVRAALPAISEQECICIPRPIDGQVRHQTNCPEGWVK